MSNSVTESVASAYKINPTYVSIVLAVIVGAIIFDKSKSNKIIDALNKIVPVMAALYLGVVIFVIVTNITSFPAMLKDIFYQAFGGKEFLGGTVGGIIMQGVRRGLFSNEAGSGNSNYAAAVVDIDEPAKQGMVQALGVFVDTLIICSATAFVILLAGVEKVPGESGMLLDGKILSGMTLFQEALKTHIGWIGIPFTVVTIFFFSLSTILAVAFYGKSAVSFINKRMEMNIAYQIIIVIMTYIGGIQQNIFVWSLADFGLGIMTVINIICILLISKDALIELAKYEKKLKAEK